MRRPTRSTAVTIVVVVLAIVVALALAYVVFGPGLSPADGPSPAGGNATGESPSSSGGEVSAGLTPKVEEIPEGGTGENFQLVAHEPLLDEHQYVGDESFGLPRGSNGEIAAVGDCVYVGSMIGHQPPLVVDVADPSDPEVVGPVPDAVPGVGNGIEGIEASGDVLVVNHRNAQGGLAFDPPEGLPKHGLSVWDISDDCREPELVARHDSGDLNVHALRLWRDPQDPDRLLGVQTHFDRPHVQVFDLTGCPDADACDPAVVAEWDLENQTGVSGAAHEAIVSTDGNRIYVAQPDVGYLLVDSSNLVSSLRGEGDCDPATPEDPTGEGHCLTVVDPTVEESLDRQPGFESGIPHTLAKVPGRPYFLAVGESSGPDWHANTTAERYGKCPGENVRIHALDDATDDSSGNDSGAESIGGTLDPEPVGSYALPEQRAENCESEGWKEGAVPAPGWLSPHLPTVFPDVAFVTYYGGGVRAVDISDPAAPREVGHFINEPVEEVRWAYHGTEVDHVTNEDGRTIRVPPPNTTHPFAFSYPVFKDGYLVYADSQSGLYVLEYTGPHAEQVPDDGTCIAGNPGAVEPGYEPCPPYGGTDWRSDANRSAAADEG